MQCLRQIKYFQAAVRHKSFSEAAEECCISQSAISQGIKALEAEIGFELFERRNRTFFLTKAGEFFYKKSLILISDFEALSLEAARIAQGETAEMTLGCLKSWCGNEIALCLHEFSERFPLVKLTLACKGHEGLFALLRSGEADLVFSDQRRAFSDEYVNLVLASIPARVAVSASSPLAEKASLEAEEMKGTICILVSSKDEGEREAECAHYRDVMGFSGPFLFAESLEEARLMVSAGLGAFPLEGEGSYFAAERCARLSR